MKLQSSVGYWSLNTSPKIISTSLGLASAIVLGMSDRAQAVQPPTTLPAWQQTVADCVTGDNNFDPGEFDTPDPGCDDFSTDLYERPFTSGEENRYRPDQDIVVAEASQDQDWYYFRIELFGLRNSELRGMYSIEADVDGDGCTDWLWTIDQPTTNIRDEVGLDQWGQSKAIAYYDSNNDVGGANCIAPNNGNGDGYDQKISDEGAGSDPDGLWVMSPSGEDDRVVILAVQKSMIAVQNSNQLPSSLFWRGWADGDLRDPSKFHYHDSYSARDAGDPYDEDNPSDAISRLDSTNGLDDLNELVTNTYDYGDAPSIYGTLDSDNGPSHLIVDGLLLGSLVDADTDGFGDGQDTNGNAADDSPGDDGITSFARLYDDSFDDAPVYGVNINVTNTTSQAANLVGWIDFNGNNQFENSESVSKPIPAGTNAENFTLIFDVPNDIQSGTTYARFRLTTDSIDGNNPLGDASNGEVEDYVLTVSSALPLPTNLSCGSPASFPWEGDPGGYIWNIDDTNNSYSIPNLYDVDITLSDPDNQNLDSGNPGTFSPPGYTRTAGVFGSGVLTWSMTADNSDQIVTMTIDFSEASVLSDMTIIDIDAFSFATSFFRQPSGSRSFAQAARESFQDEILVTASFRGDNIPVTLQAGEAGLLTIDGQTAKGSYPFNDASSSLSSSDPRGHVRLSTTSPIDTLVLNYSNGPEDAAIEQPNGGTNGISDDHSVAIRLWTFCEAFPEIRGTVWDDDNNPNGIREGSEGNISNVGVELYDAGDRNNANASPIAATTTASDGTYEFNNQIPGDYFIRFVLPLDRGFTGQDLGSDDTQDSDADIAGNTATFTLVAGVPQENWDAGLVTTTATNTAEMLLVKRITAINGDRTANPNDGTALNAVDLNDSDTADEHPDWPAGYLIGAGSAGNVRPGDELEYTLYFLSSGDVAISSVNICDLIPADTTYVPDSGEISLGSDPATNWDDIRSADAGEYIAPGATVSAADVPGIGLCRSDRDTTQDLPAAENTNGTVWVQVDNALSPVPAGQVGYVRFRARVNQVAIPD